jgi:pimeloyl-ACP methyl ester carboxylesterase
MMLTERPFDTGSIRLNLAEGPDAGPPMVLLHGASARWQGWDPVLASLTTEWHVYAPDLRGHGRSDRASGHYRLSDYAGDVSALLEREIGAPALVYGHALGALVALVVAAQRPDLVRAVIVGDSPLTLDGLRAHADAQRPMTQAWRAMIVAGMDAAAVARALRDVRVPAADGTTVPTSAVVPEDSGWYESMAENLLALDPDQLGAILDRFDDSFEGFDMDALLPRITCPVLLLQADPDAGGLLAYADVGRAIRLLESPAHVRLKGVGHGLHLQDPARVLVAVWPFLEGIHRYETGGSTLDEGEGTDWDEERPSAAGPGGVAP